ncbi:MAG: flagellar biosynthesis anti-sigma factor FlgM [Azonexus sp.]
MSAEIGKLSSVQPTATQERERVSRGAGDAGGTRGTPTTKGLADEVKLSSSALQLQDAERRLAQQPDVDQARVAAIREAVSAGTYRVNAARLADGILAQERLFVAGQRQ